MAKTFLWERVGAGARFCRSLAAATIILGLSQAPDAAAHSQAQNQVLLRSAPGDLDILATQHGLSILRTMERSGEILALVEGPPGMTRQQVIELLASESLALDAEEATLAALPDARRESTAVPNESDILPDLLRTGEFTGACNPGAALWAGYADQRAAQLIGLHQAHALSSDCGDAIVAMIDTGVDPDHPALTDVLIPGFDFLTGQRGTASEWAGLGHSVSAILEHSVSAILEETERAVLAGRSEMVSLDASIAPLLEPSSIATLEGAELPDFFGHGTMAAGLVHLVAPEARIMPLRVFDANGQGQLFDVIRAIYFAVDNGADVINMSFSLDTRSRELQRAVHYARQQGVVCVAAAGNQNAHNAQVFPAAFGDTVGVASTSLDDQLSEFSNFGSGTVTLAAPGHGVISTYPGSLYAAGWGTSFSAPLVSGAAALALSSSQEQQTPTVQAIINALAHGSTWLADLAGQIGHGRLDLPSTLEAIE